MIWHFPASAHAAAFPHARAVSIDGDAHTWRTLMTRAAHLQPVWERTLKPDARVMLPAERSLRFVEHFVALIRAGRHVVLVSPEATDGELQHAREVAAVTDFAPLSSLPALEAQIDAPATHAVPWAPDRALLSVLTSGTTGLPKAITLRAEQVIFSSLGSAARLGALPTDRWHAPLPLHHVGGIMVLLRALIFGFEAEYTSHFNVAQSAERLRSAEVTLASFVPVMLERILEENPDLRGPATLRAILLGGAATPPRLLERAARANLPIARSWGMSETASQIATAAPGDFDSPLAPLPFAAVELLRGRLVIDGPQALDGRFTSADRGEVTPEGVHIHGRADDIFISGGENVDPVEIERVLTAHPQVENALVIGVPSRRWGHKAVAFVVANALSVEALRMHCEDALEKFKIPKSFYFVPDIPRSGMGKPSRMLAMRDWQTHYANRDEQLDCSTASSGEGS